MAGRIAYTPEALRNLDDLDAWIAAAAGPTAAERFVTALLDHIESILTFPEAGRARDDVRPGVRTTTYKKRTLIAYEIGGPMDEDTITVLGIFHGGRDWPSAVGERG